MADDKINAGGIKTLKELINNPNNKYPAIELVKTNKNAAALFSKLIHSNNPLSRQIEKDTSGHMTGRNAGKFKEISENTEQKINDNENIFQLFPDIELAAQILISSILSPNDMFTIELIYGLKQNILPPQVTNALMKCIKNNLESYYELDKKIATILRESFFDIGSYVTAIIPESSLDELINKNRFISTEHLTDIIEIKNNEVHIKHIGFLGNTKNTDKSSDFSLESFTYTSINNSTYNYKVNFNSNDKKEIPLALSVIDNFDILKLPIIAQNNNLIKTKHLISKIRTGNNINLSTESNKINKKFEIKSGLFKSTSPQLTPFVKIHGQNDSYRKSVGRPLTLKLPSESVIPIHVPGDPTSHIGYFVLIDIDGNPVSRLSESRYNNSMTMVYDSAKPITSFLLEKANRNLKGKEIDRKMYFNDAAVIYGDLIEKELIERIKNGLFGQNVSIANNQEIYRIMLARQLANQHTNLLFIPKELVSYFAFSYHPNGIGKSALDNLKILLSLRSMLLFSNVMARAKNSIAQTVVKLTLDPNDHDPEKTIEEAVHEVIRANQQNFPLGVSSPTDLVYWVQRAGYQFTFEGHPDIPSTSFDFETKNLDHQVPDNELEEILRKETYMALSLSPEVVEQGLSSSEFATTARFSNQLFSKRVYQLQVTFSNKLTEDTIIKINNDTVFKEELVSIIKTNLPDIKKYNSNFYLGLAENDPNINIDNKKKNTENNEINEKDEIELILDLLIDNLEIKLPQPNTKILEDQISAYNQYSDAVDKAISDAYINADMVGSELGGEIGQFIEPIKAIYKAYKLREWMANNNYLPELSEISTLDNEGKPSINLYESVKQHFEGVLKSVGDLVSDLSKARDKGNADIQNSTGLEGGDISSSSETEGSSEGGEDEFGTDEFNELESETNMENTESEEEIPVEDEGDNKNKDTKEDKNNEEE